MALKSNAKVDFLRQIQENIGAFGHGVCHKYQGIAEKFYK